jgi:uncharacterized protein YndB with AHSA1/START domain
VTPGRLPGGIRARLPALVSGSSGRFSGHGAQIRRRPEMADFTRTYEVNINAPVHDVFEYCRDPRHLFGGWPGVEVADVVMTPEGVGTTARIVAKLAKGMMVEQIEREYTGFVPDERIVSKAHVKVRFLGRTKDTNNAPVITWLFEGRDGGTRLSLIFLEEDLGRFQNLTESVSAAVVGKNMHSMLTAIKNGVESQTSPAA